MPSPRIFVSSTCYDLHDVRHALREFIEGFGHEPVMSEYGDIFYQYDSNVQDACIAEIEKCHLFVLTHIMRRNRAKRGRNLCNHMI